MPRHTPILSATEANELVISNPESARSGLARVVVGGVSLVALIGLLFL